MFFELRVLLDVGNVAVRRPGLHREAKEVQESRGPEAKTESKTF